MRLNGAPNSRSKARCAAPRAPTAALLQLGRVPGTVWLLVAMAAVAAVLIYFNLPKFIQDGGYLVINALDALVEHEADRRSVVVALGGGVVGDIAGFAAATCIARSLASWAAPGFPAPAPESTTRTPIFPPAT